jgi:Fe-S cluster assembly protein SufD
MTQVAHDKQTHMAHYRRILDHDSSGDGDPGRFLRALRKKGIERFDAVGFPVTTQEEWRLTNVAAIARVPFVPAVVDESEEASREAARWGFGADAAAEIVVINGHYSAKLSRLGKLPRGVTVAGLAVSLEQHGEWIEPVLGQFARAESNPFVALNTGFLSDGVFVHIARGTAVEKPIHLLFVSTAGEKPAVAHPRVLIVAEPGASATIVESYVGAAGVYWTNAVTEIVVGAGAVVDHCKVQQESRQAFHTATMQVELGEHSNFISHSATLGAQLCRNDLTVRMGGERAEATLNGLVILSGTQHADNHTLLDHARANCPSHELYKHVLADQSVGVFNGKILVRADAQKTDSKQTSKSLLLSDQATMNSQPALEIYADDVKCTHGSTTGPVDEEMVFYLRSRGVGAEAARHLLSYAFAADVTRRIRVEKVRQRLEDFLAAQHGLPRDLRITDPGTHDEAAR